MAIDKTFAQKIDEVSTRKVLLAHLEPSERAVTWTLDSGAIYKRTPKFYVIDVRVGTTSLTEASSSTLSAGEWYYDVEANEVYVRMSDDSNPKDNFVSLDYRLFMANAPYVATHDLTDTGNEVEYEARIKSNPSFPQEIDNADQLGISLESKGSIALENMDGFWEPYFDKLFWEDKTVKLFIWFPDTKISRKQKIFEGVIKDKSYKEEAITFQIKDFIFKLRQPVNLGFYTTSDGDIGDDVLGRPKRRLYGQVTGVDVQSLDKILNGFSLTGTISGTAGSATITGSGTSFLSECSPGDEIKYTLLGNEEIVRVDSVETDTSLTISSDLDRGFSALSATNLPEIPYRQKNRTFLIAGHKLREPTTTITAIDQQNRITVGDTSDMFENDVITVNGNINTIKRVPSSTNLVLLQNLTSPAIGQTVTKNPVTNVSFNKLNMVLNRDYTVTNTTEAKLVLNALTEFNTTIRQKIIGTPTFTSSSRNITGTGTKFLSQFKPRDWIISGDVSHQVWYEILQVNDDDDMDIRVAYAGATTSSGTPGRKAVTYIGDDSKVIVDCLGMENASGEWVKTASNVVKDLLQNDAGITNINTASFDESDEEAPFIMSLKLPLQKTGTPPAIRNVIKLVNKSVFGSLITKTTFDMAYNVFNAEKPSTLSEISDDDVIGDNGSFSVSTRSRVVRKANIRYNFFDLDRINLEPGNSLIESTNTTEFIDNLVGTKNELDVDVYLLNQNDATIIAERYAFFYSLSQQVVRVVTDLRLTLNNINDKIIIAFDRLFQRFGGLSSRKKIGIISKIKRSGNTTDAEFTDLSGIFNRVATIAPDTANDFTSATETEKIFNGYIVDNSTELPDSSATTDDEWGANVIG